MTSERRVDPFLGTPVHVVTARQDRPNLPSDECPFCVGGREAPDQYSVRAFPNRWPALAEGRCEVVLYTPEHDASFSSLGAGGARQVIDLWADRTTALSALDDVEFVLIFENRGTEVGATISHPHGQIYAFDHVPPRPHRRFEAGWRPDTQPTDRFILEHKGWQVSAQFASVYPIALSIAPTTHLATLSDASGDERDGLAEVLVDVLSRLDRIYDAPLPYMMWIYQAPSTTSYEQSVWFNIEIVSPWRSQGVQRYIAAAEVACEEYFNPVNPSEVAQKLRDLK